jgi:hypothetical protein
VGETRLVRLRLFPALVTMFAIPIAIVTPVARTARRNAGAADLTITPSRLASAC